MNITRRRVVTAIRELCVSSLPWTPNRGKWTKTGPCVDFYFRSNLCGVLAQVWNAAYGKDCYTNNEASIDAGWFEETAWRALQGSRAKRGSKLVHDLEFPILTTMLAILLEPLRWLAGWFLHISSPETRGRPARWASPPLAGFAHWQTSPILRVLQCYSSVLAGTALRCQLFLFARSAFEF